MTRNLCFFIFSCILIFTGCARPLIRPVEDAPVKAMVLYQGSVCSRMLSKAGASWIDTPEDYDDVFQMIGKHGVGGKAPKPPVVDFQASGVLLVRMGTRPTAGYRLVAEQQVLQIKGDIARIAIEWAAPPADAVLAQVVTCPCTLIRIPKTGYGLIEVVDQHGEVRAMIDIRS